jgi:thiol-disulfide isomerase/thioredoxin
MSLQRRTLWMAGVAVAAGGAGALLATRRFALQPVMSEAETAFWAGSFDGPNGEAVRVADFRGKPLLVNFWATWCAPCVREMPEIDRFYNDFKANGWQVVGLAIDGPTPVREFLGRVKVGFPIGLAGLDGTELVKTLGNAQGGLPFTVAFDAAGRLVQRKLGETSYEELAGWARQIG